MNTGQQKYFYSKYIHTFKIGFELNIPVPWSKFNKSNLKHTIKIIQVSFKNQIITYIKRCILTKQTFRLVLSRKVIYKQNTEHATIRKYKSTFQILTPRFILLIR